MEKRIRIIVDTREQAEYAFDAKRFCVERRALPAGEWQGHTQYLQKPWGAGNGWNSSETTLAIFPTAGRRSVRSGNAGFGRAQVPHGFCANRHPRPETVPRRTAQAGGL